MFARHNLLWLSAAGWRAGRNSVTPTLQPVLKRWQRTGWPAIVRRMESGTEPDQVCLGIALPPDPVTRHKVRIAFHAPVSEISRSSRPLALSAAIASTPPRWRHPMGLLAAEIGQHDLTFEVYGSLALQALTATSYVTEQSDIDILFSPTTRRQLETGVALLQQYAKHLPLDGEIRFPSGQAVAWKEWAQALHDCDHSRVLVKESLGVRLVTTSALMASLTIPEAAPCASSC